MGGGSSSNSSIEPSGGLAEFEKLRDLVELEFEVEEGLVEYGVPTFYVKLRGDSKKAFLRLLRRLDPVGFVATLKMRIDRPVLQIVPKRSVVPGRRMVNVGLFFATMGTVLLAGYLQSRSLVEAVMFVGAIMAVVVTHEMGHKFAADKYGVEASYPYFIPGPPPFGTFGAVIQQKSLPPNKDALFDLGASGPVVGFIVTIVVTILGIPLSRLIPLSEVPPGAFFIQPPILFRLISDTFRPAGTGDVIMLHSVAFAGWVGMLVTMLNLVPAGMLDGGHVAEGLLGHRMARGVLSFLGILTLLVFGHWLMAMMAFLLSMQRHPGPLDNVSGVSTGRKLFALMLVFIFVLCAAPVWPF